jgi:hypothetical protein
MKNILKAIAFIACLMLPLSAMAMSAISDSDLSTMTGQSGVSINLDVAMDMTVSSIAWGDSDGAILTGAGNIGGNANNEGWVGLTGLNANGIRVQLRTDLITGAFMGKLAQADLTAAVTSYMQNGGTLGAGADPANPLTWVQTTIEGQAGGMTLLGHLSADLQPMLTGQADSLAIAPLTIDVATGGPHPGLTFVRIGLGSLEISMNSLIADVKVSHNNILGNTNSGALTVAGPATDGILALDNKLGSIYLGGLDVFVNGGSYVDIYARGAAQQGVVLGLAVTIDKLNIDTLAWGDSDGIGGTTSAGWVGLTGLKITNLTINGTVGIDVATPASGQTYVNIGLTNLAIGIGGLDANVALGSSTSTLTQVLGSIYLSNMVATIGGSVQISAPATGSGVIIDLNSLSIAVSPFTVSWGEAAGFAAKAGYVGLTNFAITGLTLNGLVTIDVATLDPNAPVTGTRSLMYAGYPTHNLSTSFVHIGLGTGNADDGTSLGLDVGIGSLAANVVLAADKTLTTGAGTLGKIYGAGIDVKMNGWVDIAAH